MSHIKNYPSAEQNFSNRILLLSTGGTIEALNYVQTPENVSFGEGGINVISSALQNMKLDGNCDFLPFVRKDSKDISEGDLQTIAALIKIDPRNHIVITHGTDTMPQNSRTLQRLLQDCPKTVVITGSMEPLLHGEQSDGYKNLKVSLERIGSLEKGVHVIMGGEIFNPIGLRKNFDKKEFYTVPPRNLVLQSVSLLKFRFRIGKNFSRIGSQSSLMLI
jgi:L-asparaginase